MVHIKEIFHKCIKIGKCTFCDECVCVRMCAPVCTCVRVNAYRTHCRTVLFSPAGNVISFSTQLLFSQSTNPKYNECNFPVL